MLQRSTAPHVLVVAVVVVLAALCGWAWSDRAELRPLGMHGAFAESRLESVLSWKQRPPRAGVLRAFVFGDSLVGCTEGSVDDELWRQLAAAGLPIELLDLTHPGFRPIHLYSLIDDILAGGFRLAILEINLRAFSDRYFDITNARFPTLSRRLSLHRAWIMRGPLADEGQSLVDPWVYRVEEWVGALYVADGVRELGRQRLESYGQGLDAALGLADVVNNTRSARSFAPLTREVARAEYAVDQAGHPTAFVLRELLRRLRAAHVTTVLYVSPIDVDAMRQLGILDELALPDRLAALRLAIGAAPEEWLDLHALVPSRVFRDSRSHMWAEGCRRVASALREAVLRRASPERVSSRAARPASRTRAD